MEKTEFGSVRSSASNARCLNAPRSTGLAVPHYLEIAEYPILHPSSSNRPAAASAAGSC